jgi:RES domain-containing protein
LQRKRHGLELSGFGASLRGARWNSAGVEIIYTSAGRSLAMAEIAVHFTIATLPLDFYMLQIFIPDSTSIRVLQESHLPVNWNVHPPPLANQHLGNNFIREKSTCLLKIPSAVTRGDFNILINPAHPEFSGLKVLTANPFPFDRRLFGGR